MRPQEVIWFNWWSAYG